DRPGAGVQVVEEVSRPGRPGGSGDTGRQTGSSGRGAAPATPTRPTRCTTWDAPWQLAWWGNSIPGEQRVKELSSGDLVAGKVYYRECRYLDDGSVASYDRFVHQPGSPTPAAAAATPEPPDVETIARQVYAEVPLVTPEPHTSPPPDAPQLVGFPVYLWVDDLVWRDFSATASVSGISVTVVARPAKVEWDMGDGTVVTCQGSGEAGDERGADAGAGRCSHVYQHVSDDQPGGRYRASVTVTWIVTWSASTGQSGTLPPASRSADFTMLVTERQAVVRHGR
ncbi:MAG TPA: hypothetical protein VIL36_21870, partial [Acidimicrobiales bacterium]